MGTCSALDNHKGKEGVIVTGIPENLLSTLWILLDCKGKKLEGHLSSLSYFAFAVRTAPALEQHHFIPASQVSQHTCLPDIGKYT